MARSSDSELLVLHGLKLKSMVTADALAGLVGLPAVVVADLLEGFQAKEWVRYREGALTGWMLLPAGRSEEQARVAHELDAAGADVRAEVDAAYRQFLDLNQAMLQVCTDWQLRPAPEGSTEPVINDHADVAYDENVIGVLKSINAEAQPIAASLASILDRFAGYGLRFSTALTKVELGDHDWFTKPMIDSYHTVWFELHEDLLSTLGIERGQEEAT